jgi:hypothetical protein
VVALKLLTAFLQVQVFFEKTQQGVGREIKNEIFSPSSHNLGRFGVKIFNFHPKTPLLLNFFFQELTSFPI